jgi:hypothetical protein
MRGPLLCSTFDGPRGWLSDKHDRHIVGACALAVGLADSGIVLNGQLDPSIGVDGDVLRERNREGVIRVWPLGVKVVVARGKRDMKSALFVASEGGDSLALIGVPDDDGGLQRKIRTRASLADDWALGANEDLAFNAGETRRRFTFVVTSAK